ncbi:hypothetical protein C5167_037486 [Papaver somniferum]|uniref:Beta-catenin-like protein 1 N-terminal domain-containing protein n=1 Tax=Papaver somniferum TaxID=3469 RepID=A0A4Y7I9M5_PAPSO|nr:hypothetical protein C5167_037486 [Papaver somniferum]
MSSMENRREFGKMDAVIVVVNALSSLEEDFVPHEEYLLQTLFCCLLFLLECPDNIVRFAEAGGVQSMIGIIQQEDFGYCHGSAIVALDKAVEAYQSAYEEFVNDDLAFDTAFHPFRDMAYRDNIGNAGESVESPKTAMEECIDSLEVMKCY